MNSQPIAHTINMNDTLYYLAQYYKTSVASILSLNPDLDPDHLVIGDIILIRPDDNEGGEVANELTPPTKTPLFEDMRKLWEQHVYWTRMLLISIANYLDDEREVTGRVLRNPAAIADIFEVYYGENTASILEQLLTEHLQIGSQIMTALRDNNEMESRRLEWAWYDNAGQIADFLSKINPYYSQEELRSMLYQHLNLTNKEIAERLDGRFLEDIETFDQIEEEALQMADYLSVGITRNFPFEFQNCLNED